MYALPLFSMNGTICSSINFFARCESSVEPDSNLTATGLVIATVFLAAADSPAPVKTTFSVCALVTT